MKDQVLQLILPLFPALSIAPTGLWVAFLIRILMLLTLDFSFFGSQSRPITSKMALLESGMWVLIALIFNAGFTVYFGQKLGLEFLTAYLVEKSLSLDNLFVIMMIFSSFQIPAHSQHTLLFLGVLGAMTFRTLFIFMGAQLLYHFHWILTLFGMILILMALKLSRKTKATATNHQNKVTLFVKRLLPTTLSLQGDCFFIKEKGSMKATPLFLALIVIEITDLIFTVDSLPALFTITQDAFVAFSSNLLALLGLRAFYFVVTDWVKQLHSLKTGLASILGFIGIKLLLAKWIHIPNSVSLGIIFTLLALTGLTSYMMTKKRKQKIDPSV